MGTLPGLSRCTLWHDPLFGLSLQHNWEPGSRSICAIMHNCRTPREEKKTSCGKQWSQGLHALACIILNMTSRVEQVFKRFGVFCTRRLKRGREPAGLQGGNQADEAAA